MSRRWVVVDGATRTWWRAVGRPIDPTEHPWLDAPMARESVVAESWLAELARSRDARLCPDEAGAGLLPSLAVLDGGGFTADRVDPLVRDFYEHTASWSMDAWSRWSGALAPGGRFVAWAFGRRVQQLAIPVDPLAVSRGIESRVVPVRIEDGTQLWAAWLRRLRATGDVVFSGAYRTLELPGSGVPVVHVAFPLEHGNVQVFLTPHVGERGSLVLSSGPGRFGEAGTYVVVPARGGLLSAARVPIHERFEVYAAEQGTLRTDHELRLGGLTALRLHYRMTRLGADPGGAHGIRST